MWKKIITAGIKMKNDIKLELMIQNIQDAIQDIKNENFSERSDNIKQAQSYTDSIYQHIILTYMYPDYKH